MVWVTAQATRPLAKLITSKLPNRMATKITAITPKRDVGGRMALPASVKTKQPKTLDQIRIASKTPMAMPLRMILLTAIRMKIAPET